jgi:CelD/BcsL family acetyltransferase involved in cellulose biosynthesis
MSDLPASVPAPSRSIELAAGAQAFRGLLEGRPEAPSRTEPHIDPALPIRARAQGITLEVHCDFAAVAEAWCAFEVEADATAFQTFGWLGKWQRHIGSLDDTRPVIVLGRDADATLMFLLPLAIERRHGLRRLRWLGSDLSDYNAPMLAREFSRRCTPERFAALWHNLLDLLARPPGPGFDIVDLQKMPAAVGGQPNPFAALRVLPNASGAHIATLTPDWDRFYAARRSAATRKRERKQFKNLGAHGEVRFVEITERDQAERTLETLFAQKARSFARIGVSNLFARPGYRAFFHDLATDPQSQRPAHLTRLDVGSSIAAASLGLKFGDCYYLIVSSYTDGELAKYGPGRAHLQELLRHAIAGGYKHFDFTIGDEPYKRDWSDVEMKVFDHLESRTLLGWPVVAGETLYLRLKRLIKQTPVLWNAYSRARRLVTAAAGGRAAAVPGQSDAAAD